MKEDWQLHGGAEGWQGWHLGEPAAQTFCWHHMETCSVNLGCF